LTHRGFLPKRVDKHNNNANTSRKEQLTIVKIE